MKLKKFTKDANKFKVNSSLRAVDLEGLINSPGRKEGRSTTGRKQNRSKVKSRTAAARGGRAVAKQETKLQRRERGVVTVVSGGGKVNGGGGAGREKEWWESEREREIVRVKERKRKEEGV